MSQLYNEKARGGQAPPAVPPPNVRRYGPIWVGAVARQSRANPATLNKMLEK